jgi:hypothetical protein
MKRRGLILGLAMVANAGRAGAQGRARRVGALFLEENQIDILPRVLKEK